MKTMKCPVCNGIGENKTLYSSDKISNYEVNIYTMEHCDNCAGLGEVLVDNLTYQIHINEIRCQRNHYIRAHKELSKDDCIKSSFLFCLEQYDECDCKDGVINKKEEFDEENGFITEKITYCAKCNGCGQTFNKEKTFEVINDSIKEYDDLIHELNTLNRTKKFYLNNKEIKRDYEQYKRHSNYNICLNCANHEPYGCEYKCKHKTLISSHSSYFNGIDNASKNWYNTYCK